MRSNRARGKRAIAGSDCDLALALGSKAIYGERIARHVQLPVTADVEAGYGGTDETATELAFAMISAGAVGLNFEDGTGDVGNPLFPWEQQVERIERLREVSNAIRVPSEINKLFEN